ncbi:unnamed protein product [Closterium sp. NIES-53]
MAWCRKVQVLAQHSTARHDTARHGTARHGMAWQGTARHGTARHGTAWHGTAQHGIAGHSTAWHGRARTHMEVIMPYESHHRACRAASNSNRAKEQGQGCEGAKAVRRLIVQMSTEEANVEAGNLRALEEDLVARHSRGEISDIEYELMLEGLRSCRRREHPSPRVENVEQAAGGTSAWDMAVDGGNSEDEELDGLMSRGVLRGPTRFSTASVGGVQERVHHAAASREHANVGRRSVAGGGNAEEYDSEAMPGVTPIGSMSRDEGIAPNYGYFRFTPDKIVVPRPLEGRHDLSTWTESIEAQLEIAQLKRFIDGTTPIPPARALAHLSQFRAMQLLTFTTISRCCSPTVQIALKACRMKVDASYQAWQFIMRTYMAKDDMYIG